jgi:hypothetical protein
MMLWKKYRIGESSPGTLMGMTNKGDDEVLDKDNLPSYNLQKFVRKEIECYFDYHPKVNWLFPK